jgi:hypothetical protein
MENPLFMLSVDNFWFVVEEFLAWNKTFSYSFEFWNFKKIFG